MAFNRPGGNNPNGNKWNKGGKHRRKNFIDIDFYAFADYAERLDNLGADLKKVFGDAMEEVGEEIADDTESAIASGNLPAQGKYSRGATEKSLIRSPKVRWSGMQGELPLGFDKDVPGSGGWLITGTPKMQPDYKLQDIYGRKTYQRKVNNKLKQKLQEAIDEHMGS